MRRAAVFKMPCAEKSTSRPLGASVTSKSASGIISRGKGQQFDYTFDTIGNRTRTQAGGDQNGANLRVANYTNNSLNQITGRGVPGDVDVMGIGIATNPVTVNGLTAYRKTEYFRQQVPVNNSSSALWTNITVANSGSSASGNAYVAKAAESYTYDADGNLT